MKYRIDPNGLLSGDNVDKHLCEKHSGEFSQGLPDTIVLHFTAGGSVESAVNTLTDPQIKASAHLVVGFNGETVQLVNFKHKAWHAGESQHLSRKWLNHYSIGIEVVNAGRLKKVGDEYQAWFGKTYVANEVIKGIHRNESEVSYWHAYTDLQLATVYNICESIMETYSIEFLLGHEEIAPDRKTDPGPAFPLEQFRNRLLDNDRKIDKVEADEYINTKVSHKDNKFGIVTASRLNFRAKPEKSASLLSAPLEKGTKVEIISESSGWLKVNIPITGWVKKDFIRYVNIQENE